ncbi:dipeptidyl peptidase 4-like [Dreissena polymorpha]|uniref:dipeptidyl peptidase 4-like n=1 Tax=Dreissena polymorpha TaxID=45954 RepID=UPI0022650363|nr:dipeptidyl peptidase 4-like [Dreissena polymorpha]
MGSEYDDFEEELIGSTAPQRNWRGIIIALLVIVTVLGLIVTAIVLVTPREIEENFGDKLSYKDVINHHFDPKPFHASWRSGSVLMYRSDDGGVVQFDCDSNTSTLVMDNTTFRELNTESYEISADGKFAILPYDINYIYRHSFVAKYKLFNIKTRSHRDLVGPSTPQQEGELTFQCVTWSPVGNSLAVVVQNNLYLLNDVESNTYVALTTDGAMEAVYNGVTDWLYEEEILQSSRALWWNADGTLLVYGHFDDRDVTRYTMTLYGPAKNKYVENRRLPYPKAGTRNPSVEVRVFNLMTNTTKALPPPNAFLKSDYYFTSVTWRDSRHVLVTWLNRHHNVSIVSICDAISTTCWDNFRTVAESGWLDMSSPVVTSERDAYFLILSQKDVDTDSFKHITQVDAPLKGGVGSSYFVTAGPINVLKIVGYNPDLSEVYFLASKNSTPMERHLYSSTTDKTDPDFRQPQCITCDLDPDCLYVDASFSVRGQFYVLSCKGPGVPSHQIMAVPNISVSMLEDNQALRTFRQGKAFPKVEFQQIPLENNEYTWVKVLYPPILKKDQVIKFHALFKVYGSPGQQLVTQEYEVGWEHFQCITNDLIIVYVEVRGSGGRGDQWMHAVHKRLGNLEVKDIIAAGRYFKSQQYVDPQVAIWGVSHGGFLTAALLGNPENVITCGVAVAPVTDWRYYDTFYTEKFMGYPTVDNLDAYNNSNISRFAVNFRTSRFLLVHGTGDDNVHFQHSAQLMKALTERDVYYKSLIYTDQQHWLSGGNTRNHLYNSIEDFIFKCYGKTAPRHVDPPVIEEEED